jgi:hypothetical protein
MSHPSSSRCLASNSLFTPVVAAHLGGWVGTLGAGLLLLVERAVSAATAQSMALGMAFSEAGGTFGLYGWMRREKTWITMGTKF